MKLLDPYWKRDPDLDAEESALQRYDYSDERDIAGWDGGGIYEEEDDNDSFCHRQEDF